MYLLKLFSKSTVSQLKVLFSMMFLSELGFGMITPLFYLVFYSSSSALFISSYPSAKRAVAFGIFMFVFQISSSVISPLFGVLSDIIGRKLVMLVSSLALIILPITVIISLYYHSFVGFIIAVSCGFIYSFRPVTIAGVYDYADETEHVQINSIAQFFIAMGAFLGPMIGGVLLEKKTVLIPYLLLFSMVCLLGVVMFFVVLFGFKETQKKTHKKVQRTLFPLMRLLKDRLFFLLVILLLLNQFMWGGFYRYSSVVGKTLFHFRSSKIGVFIGLLALFIMIATGLLLPFVKRFLSDRKILLLAAGSLTLGMVFVLLSIHYPHTLSGEILLWVSGVLCSVGDVIFFCMILVAFQGRVANHLKGSIVGIVYIFGEAMWAFSGLICGYLMSMDITYVFLLNILIGIVLIALVMVNQKKICP